MKILVFLILVLLILFFGILFMILKFEKSRCDEFCKYVLVLGARIIDEDTPCKVLEDRLRTSIDYLKKFKCTYVIVSGGIGDDEPVSEGFVMKKFLIRMGISENRILMEDSSRNTFENLKNTREILKDVDEILIITSGYHLFRSKILAKRIGFKKVYLIGSEVGQESRIKNIFREVFAMIKSVIFDW